jgi:hypothetical protein
MWVIVINLSRNRFFVFEPELVKVFMVEERIVTERSWKVWNHSCAFGSVCRHMIIDEALIVSLTKICEICDVIIGGVSAVQADAGAIANAKIIEAPGRWSRGAC